MHAICRAIGVLSGKMGSWHGSVIAERKVRVVRFQFLDGRSERQEKLCSTCDVCIYVRVTTQVDVVFEGLDDEYIGEHSTIERNERTGQGDKNAGAARNVANTFILQMFSA